MKINWGAGIAIFYASFMVFLLYFVIKSTTYDHSLVMDNYYEQDLNYQSHYDKMVNQQQLAQSVSMVYNPTEQLVEFVFPKGMGDSKGTILFFNPISKHRDMVKDIDLDKNTKMSLSTKLLKAGRWKIKIDWENENKAYFQELELVL